MSRHPLAIVCALAFVIGGASAFVLEYSPQGTAGVQRGADMGAVAGYGTAADFEATEARPPKGARPEEMTATDGVDDSAAQADDVSVEPANAVGVEPGRLSGGERARSFAEKRAADRLRPSRGSTNVSTRQPSTAGGGLAGRTVGGVKKTGRGVKKTGAVLGRAFGKVGGVFHD